MKGNILEILFTQVRNYSTYKNRFDFNFLKNTPGVYGIQNTKTGKVYVGASKNIKMRISTHFNRLRRGIHTVKNMQRDYDAHSKVFFKIIIYLYCEDFELDSNEIKIFENNKHNCYNKRLNPTTNKGNKMDEEAIIKMAKAVSKANKGKIPKNINYIREKQRRAIKEYDNGIFIREYESSREAGRVLGVCYKRINRVCVKNQRNDVVPVLKEFPLKTWRYSDNKPVRLIDRNKQHGR